MQEGLSQLSVMAIHQDMLGRMWFGTEEGVSVYDGVRTITYKPRDFKAQQSNFIGNKTEFIAGDNNGDIFFNSDNALIRYDIRRQEFSCIRDANVHAVCSNKGTVWVSIADSIYTWDSGQNKLIFAFQLENENQHATW
ncbi:MAG: two-component regulator propeller domain-containing protein, partial [Hungatella sp.]